MEGVVQDQQEGMEVRKKFEDNGVDYDLMVQKTDGMQQESDGGDGQRGVSPALFGPTGAPLAEQQQAMRTASSGEGAVPAAALPVPASPHVRSRWDKAKADTTRQRADDEKEEGSARDRSKTPKALRRSPVADAPAPEC